MTTVTVKIKGLEQLLKNFGDIEVKRIFVDAANRSIAEVHKMAVAEVPVDTSQLQKSHILSPATIATARAEVYTEKEYAVPVHEGHRIVAWGKDTGKNQPANPWMQRASERADGKINQIFDQAADQVGKILTQ